MEEDGGGRGLAASSWVSGTSTANGQAVGGWRSAPERRSAGLQAVLRLRPERADSSAEATACFILC